MAMLTHDLEPRFRPSEVQQRTREAARAPLTAIKRVCLLVLTILLATGAVAAVIALKTAIYFWRFKVAAG